jgi:hypothetical protein
MLTVAGIAATGAVGVWLGAIVFFSFFVAPRAFSVLGDDEAGELVNAVFPVYYSFGMVLGVVGVAAGLGRGALSEFGLYLGLYVATVGLSVFVAAVSRLYLVPRIEDADESKDEDAFEKYHDVSVKLNSVMLVSVVAALVFWHV